MSLTNQVSDEFNRLNIQIAQRSRELEAMTIDRDALQVQVNALRTGRDAPLAPDAESAKRLLLVAAHCCKFWDLDPRELLKP